MKKNTTAPYMVKYLLAHPKAGRTDVAKYVYAAKHKPPRHNKHGALQMPFSDSMWKKAVNEAANSIHVFNADKNTGEIHPRGWSGPRKPGRPPLTTKTIFKRNVEKILKTRKARKRHNISGIVLAREFLMENPTAKTAEISRYVYERQGRRVKKNIMPFSGVDLKKLRKELGIRGTRWRGVYSCRRTRRNSWLKKPHSVIRHESDNLASLISSWITARNNLKAAQTEFEHIKEEYERMKTIIGTAERVMLVAKERVYRELENEKR